MNQPTSRTWFQGITEFLRREPVSAFLLATIVVTFVYFFGFVPLFIRGTFTSGACSVFAWAWQAWNPGSNQEHSRLVPLIFVGLIFYHRKKIAGAKKAGDNKGLFFVAVGVILFVLSARCLQPRLALGSIPFLIYGG